MELKDVQQFQREFDEEFFSKLISKRSERGIVGRLEFSTIALTGEVGEFANVVKKIARDYDIFGKEPTKEMLETLKEELTDCFIYVLILANMLGMDIEKEYIKKSNFNRKRFEKYKE